MKLIFRYLARFKKTVVLAVFIKLLGTLAELTIPYIFEHIVDHVVPLGKLPPVILWGLAMFGAALCCEGLAIFAFFGCKAASKGTVRLTKFIALKTKSLFIRKGENNE